MTLETTPTKSGSDIMHEALRFRIEKGHVAPLARNLGITSAALEQFAYGEGKLPDETMTALAKDLFGSNAFFDSGANLLRRAGQIPPSRWPPVRSNGPALLQQLRTSAPGWGVEAL